MVSPWVFEVAKGSEAYFTAAPTSTTISCMAFKPPFIKYQLLASKYTMWFSLAALLCLMMSLLSAACAPPDLPVTADARSMTNK